MKKQCIFFFIRNIKQEERVEKRIRFGAKPQTHSVDFVHHNKTEMMLSVRTVFIYLYFFVTRHQNLVVKPC